MNLLTLLRSARTDNAAAIVARDALLQCGYNEARVERALLPIRVHAHGAPWSKTAPRRHVRTVVTDEIIKRAAKQAHNTGLPALRCAHGGGVANAYGYRARTECVVVVALPTGDVSVWYGDAPANKVTLSGAAAAATGRPVSSYAWDARVRPYSANERRGVRCLVQAAIDDARAHTDRLPTATYDRWCGDGAEADLDLMLGRKQVQS